MNLPKSVTTATPFSKILALVLFITFPIISFFLGFEYHRLTSQPQKEYITKKEIVYQKTEDNERWLIKRCGQYPNLPEMYENKYGANIVGNIMWSPDCRNLAWSNNKITFCENGGGDTNNCSTTSSDPSNGLYVHNVCSKKTTRVIKADLQDKDPTLIKWLDSSTIRYSDRSGKFKKEFKLIP